MILDLSDFKKQIILVLEISLLTNRLKFCLQYDICKIFSTSIFEMPKNKGFFGHLRTF